MAMYSCRSAVGDLAAHSPVLKDLHELEALQTRRRGDPTPLARVEIN
jgi:hypothetical protein